jgi:hypothetical protein
MELEQGDAWDFHQLVPREVPELKLFGKGHPQYFQCSPGGALEMKSKTVVYVVNASRTPSRLELA